MVVVRDEGDERDDEDDDKDDDWVITNNLTLLSVRTYFTVVPQGVQRRNHGLRFYVAQVRHTYQPRVSTY